MKKNLLRKKKPSFKSFANSDSNLNTINSGEPNAEGKKIMPA